MSKGDGDPSCHRFWADAAVKRFDLVVIGAGAAGLTAAREGRRLGATVALVHQGPLGGECTWTGCVPSKALIAAAESGSTFAGAMSAARRAVERLAATEDAATLAGEGITVIPGRARFRAPLAIDVDATMIAGGSVIIATGAVAAAPPIPGIATVEYLTNDTIFDLAAAPSHLAVIGGGAIGCELAQAFSRLGVRTTIVESVPRLLSREEPEASLVVADALRGDGVSVRCSAEVDRIESVDGGVRLTMRDGVAVDASHLLIAAGRSPTTAGFGLEEIGVGLDDKGHIVVDDTMATSIAGVFAAGDVTGKMQFTHAAARMAWVAANNSLRRRPGWLAKRFDSRAIPLATFTSPEVGRVGMTESDAASAGQARVAYIELDRVDRGLIADRTAGFVKLIAGPRRLLGNAGGGRLLGATIVTPNGSELVHEAALAIQTGMFVGRLAQTVHAYPTWSLAVQQAALQFFRESGGRRCRPAVPAGSPNR